MNILDIAKQRFSVRNYLTKEISQETLETILEAAHVAPTAANMQPVKLLVVKSDEAKEKLAKAEPTCSIETAVVPSTHNDTMSPNNKGVNKVDHSMLNSKVYADDVKF